MSGEIGGAGVAGGAGPLIAEDTMTGFAIQDPESVQKAVALLSQKTGELDVVLVSTRLMSGKTIQNSRSSRSQIVRAKLHPVLEAPN
jgi:hypothetical protein